MFFYLKAKAAESLTAIIWSSCIRIREGFPNLLRHDRKELNVRIESFSSLVKKKLSTLWTVVLGFYFLPSFFQKCKTRNTDSIRRAKMEVNILFYVCSPYLAKKMLRFHSFVKGNDIYLRVKVEICIKYFQEKKM